MQLPSGKNVYSSTPIYPGSHFTWGEATKNCTRPIQDLVIDGKLIISAVDIEKNIVQTAKNMDKYRQQLGGKPIIVNSWYRPAHVNSQVSNSKWSRHQYGDAVDWVCSHLTPAQIASQLEPHHNAGGYKCYSRQNFTHTDWRGQRARW